jgi:hypothetical protein
MSILRRLILAAALIAGIIPAMAQVPPPVPGLPDTERRTSYSLTASTCACSVGFQLYGDSTDYQDWVEVFVNGVLVTYNDPVFGWTITSLSQPSLATAPRPITDAILTFNHVQTGTIQIVGARRPRRVTQFNENTGVPARNLNQALTDIIAMLREDWDKINDVTGRAVLAPPGETINVLTAMANRANQGACFDSGGNLIPCVSVPISTFSAGNGIAFTGVNPTVIKNNIQASSPITITGTNPLTVACPTCVAGSGSSIVGDLPQLSNTSTTGITDAGFNAQQLPGLTPSTATVTISIATPGVVTWTAHGLTANAPVYFCTTGTLPTGLTACNPVPSGSNLYFSNPTVYYVVGSSITTNTFQVATSIANAKAGIAVTTSGSQSGTQTAFANAVAPAGTIGEHIYNVVPFSGTGSVACNNSSPDTVFNSITLTPGIWKVWGSAGVFGSSTAVFSTNHSSYGIGITSICTTPYCGTTDWHLTTNASNGVLFPYNASVIPVFTSSTINAVSEPVWTGSGATATCFGDLHAERIH